MLGLARPVPGGSSSSAMRVASSRYWAITGGDRIRPLPTLSKPCEESSDGNECGKAKSEIPNRSRIEFSYSARLSRRGTPPPTPECASNWPLSHSTMCARSCVDGWLVVAGGILAVDSASNTLSHFATASRLLQSVSEDDSCTPA